MPLSTRGLSPLFLATNALIWISSVIVMGIVSYWFSTNMHQPDSIIYIEVISVLTTVFFLGAYFLGAFLHFLHLFNLIFSYLWLVAVVFTATMFTHSRNALAHTVEAFSFIAFFALFFNVLYSWHLGYRGERVHGTTHHRGARV
ncbi:unnamed protein product [Parascedosporium putredinis]|uniref:MARVEL domain-containing protein n=1 Tax=Parascedosporium putredinis TaxID=1442378 RepID=A0A9P1GXB2_9PEZI|nr:unnamed protein product [Parascedosporium putredinis]CAI7989632.1 unnamed protein product [Parascedosporium putredinis]